MFRVLFGSKLCSGSVSLLVFYLFMLIYSSQGLYEDQIGKFDWHQKYFGHIRFVVNDQNQPKRILVGAENNVIGAVHGNSGVILYRQILESNGKLFYFGNYQEKNVLAISAQESLIKLRTFIASSGIQSDQWVVKADITHATEIGSKIYLLNNAEDIFPELTISVYTLGDEQEKDAKLIDSKSVKLGLPKPGICDVAAPYFICASQNVVSVVNLVDGSVSTKTVTEDGDILSISTSGSGEIPAVAFQGNGFTRIFQLLENSNSGPEMMPINYPSTSSKVSLSQFRNEDRPILFISRLESPNSIKVDALNRNSEVMESLSTIVQSPMPIASLAITRGYCINGRCGLVGFTKDELLFGTKVDGVAGSKTVKVEWSRQEALSSVLAVEMVDYPSEVGPTWNPYLASLDVLTAFVSRVKFEVETIITGESLYSSAADRFGLRKVIVFVTSVGKVLGMDSSSGSVLYTFLLPDFELMSDSSVMLYIQRPAKYTPLKPQASVIYRSKSSLSGETILFAFNPVEGKPLDEPKTFPPVVQTQMLLTAPEATKFVKPILMLDASNIVHVYPADSPNVKNAYFFLAKQTSPPILQGLGIRASSTGGKPTAKMLWELSLGRSELLGVHGKLTGERVHSQGRVLPDRSVSYKYMNPNLVVVVTSETEAGNINIYFVDAVSGSVIHSLWHKKCRGPVHVVHSEHWIVYSLFSEKNRRIEVNSVELYEGQSQSNSSVFSSFAAPTIRPIVVKQSFIFPTGIQQMSYTRTEKGITNKDILIALPNGGVLELPRMILQPRLSQQHYTQQIQDEDGVIHSLPYIPELPTPPDMIINYNQSVRRVDGIKTWPTRLESTCLVLIYGNDIFYTPVTPSKTFDVLKDDFDHWFITVVLFGLCAGAYLTKRLAARKTLEQAWR